VNDLIDFEKSTNWNERLTTFKKFVEKEGIGLQTLVPLLPLLLNLKGKPYTLKNHFAMEPLFRTRLPSNVVVKAARQISKCNMLVDKSLIRLSNGKQIKAADVKIGDKLLALNDETLKWTTHTVTNIYNTGVKPGLYLKTAFGSELYVTAEHRLLTFAGYKKAGDLKPGDEIVAIRNGGSFIDKPICRSRIIMTAYMIGDGCCVQRNLTFTSKSVKVLKEFKKIAEALQEGRPVRLEKHGNINTKICCHTNSKMVEWFVQDKLLGKYSYEKPLPDWVYDLSRTNTILFLSRLWATDGMIKRRHGHADILYSTTCYNLAHGVRSLLNKLGIPTSIHQKKAGYKAKNGDYVSCRDVYNVVVITAVGCKLFLKLIRAPGKRSVKVKEAQERKSVPIEAMKTLQNIVQAASVKLPPMMLLCRRKHQKSTTVSMLRRYTRLLKQRDVNYRELNKYVNNDVVVDRIKFIKHIEANDSIDIETDGRHNYIYDGIVSHNSTSTAAKLILLAASKPYFNILTVTPLFEQIRRFSGNNVGPMINTSPVKSILINTNTVNSVLQRSFKNNSQLFFSFALLDADRIRGIDASMVNIDEVQDMDRDHIPIIKETMSGSDDWGVIQFTGTPKTLDNTIEGLWSDSSRAEWVIRCDACHYDNVPCLSHDVEKMIGPWRQDISEAKPAVICAKCRKSIFPRKGRWVHKYPEKRWNFAGYHIPQIIMPTHFTSNDKWSSLLGKQRGQGNFTIGRFYNEVLGESYDTGMKLVTQSELQQAAILHENTEEEALKVLNQYDYRILAIDWGGGGEKEVSFTVAVVMGIRGDGRIDVIFAKKSLTPHDHMGEASMCMRLFSLFDCHMIAHDYTGAGSIRETVLVHKGVSPDRIIPIAYVRTAKHDYMSYVAPTNLNSRAFWRVDKARSLQLTCHAIKLKKVLFFKYDYINNDDPGLLHDFLALIENKINTHHAGDIYTIQRNPMFPDDFAQAVNIGACALWHMTGNWPVLSEVEYQNTALSDEQSQALGNYDSNWNDDPLSF